MAGEVPLEVFEDEDGFARARTARGDRVVPFPTSGGGTIPPDLEARLASLEVWRPQVDARLLATDDRLAGVDTRLAGIDTLIEVLQHDGASAGRMLDLMPEDIEWWQDNSVPNANFPSGGRVRITNYWDSHPNYQGPTRGTGKFVCQAFHVPGGLSWFSLLIVLGIELCKHLPEVNVMVGGGWEWRLPFPLRRARADDGQGPQPRFRGYADFPCAVYCGDHEFHMAGIGKIRTEGPDLSTAFLAMNAGLYPRVNQKGALNYRSPFIISDGGDSQGVQFKVWTNGSWLKATAVLPTD